MKPAVKKSAKTAQGTAVGACLCGAVRLEIDIPAFWAWHDYGEPSRHAQGCAYATYVGCWRTRFRVLQGAENIRQYEDAAVHTTRSFCSRCGTPLLYERARAPRMVNIPRAIFKTRTGRKPRYHLFMEQAPEWAYRSEPLVPLKGYPGVLWERPGRKKRRPEAL